MKVVRTWLLCALLIGVIGWTVCECAGWAASIRCLALTDENAKLREDLAAERRKCAAWAAQGSLVMALQAVDQKLSAQDKKVSRTLEIAEKFAKGDEK